MEFVGDCLKKNSQKKEINHITNGYPTAGAVLLKKVRRNLLFSGNLILGICSCGQ